MGLSLYHGMAIGLVLVVCSLNKASFDRSNQCPTRASDDSNALKLEWRSWFQVQRSDRRRIYLLNPLA